MTIRSKTAPLKSSSTCLTGDSDIFDCDTGTDLYSSLSNTEALREPVSLFVTGGLDWYAYDEVPAGLLALSMSKLYSSSAAYSKAYISFARLNEPIG